MPMAVITGYDPTVFIVSCTRTPPGVDEFHLAGALRGEPVEMVKCKTIDIEVPATSEVVFEGFIRPEVRHMEGGFGEYTGYYCLRGPGRGDARFGAGGGWLHWQALRRKPGIRPGTESAVFTGHG